MKLKSGQAMEEGVNIDGKKLNSTMTGTQGVGTVMVRDCTVSTMMGTQV